MHLRAMNWYTGVSECVVTLGTARNVRAVFSLTRMTLFAVQNMTALNMVPNVPLYE